MDTAVWCSAIKCGPGYMPSALHSSKEVGKLRPWHTSLPRCLRGSGRLLEGHQRRASLHDAGASPLGTPAPAVNAEPSDVLTADPGV